MLVFIACGHWGALVKPNLIEMCVKVGQAEPREGHGERINNEECCHFNIKQTISIAAILSRVIQCLEMHRYIIKYGDSVQP